MQDTICVGQKSKPGCPASVLDYPESSVALQKAWIETLGTSSIRLSARRGLETAPFYIMKGWPMETVAVIVATYGDRIRWNSLAKRALQSVINQTNVVESFAG